MIDLAKINKISELFWQDGGVCVTGTEKQNAQLKAKCADLANCHWLEATDIIADTQKHYRTYTYTNECRRLYANIVLALTGKPAPKTPRLLRWHDILEENFLRNGETAIFLHNPQFLKKRTLECFLADGKYFHQYERNRTLVAMEEDRMEFEQKFKAYFVIVIVPGTELPSMEPSIITHVRPCNLTRLMPD